jgi:hypothetical protein
VAHDGVYEGVFCFTRKSITAHNEGAVAFLNGAAACPGPFGAPPRSR